MLNAIGHRIELGVGQNVVACSDCDSVRELANDFFKSIGDRLLDFFLIELDELSRRMEASVPDCSLPRWKIMAMFGKNTHFYHLLAMPYVS